MNRRIFGLAAAHASAGLLIVSAIPAGPAARTTPAELAAFAALFALVASLPVHLEFRRGSLDVVLDEAVWLVGLFALSPAGLVAAAVAGDAVSRLIARQAPLKMAYNVVTTFLASAVGAALFAALASPDAGSPAAWLAAAAAAAAWAATSWLSIALVLAVVEARPVAAVLADSATTQLVVTAANASLGIAAAALLRLHPAGPLLLAPAVGLVLLLTRRHTLQTAEHLRFERLYAAAARTGELAGFDAALATLAAEARMLVTGSVALCCAPGSSGAWVGVRVDDTGAAAAEPDAVEVLAALAQAGETRTVVLGELPAEVRAALPDGVDLVVAAPAPPAKVVLAVFREIAPDGQNDLRWEVLGAFAGHAALVVANALLYEEVDAALQREKALGRQKSEFVAAVSHELRTPLTTVLGVVATMQRLGDRLDPPTQAKLLARALDQGDRLRHLIDELLLVAAAQHRGLRTDITPVDLAGLAADVARAIPEPAGGRVHLDLAGGTGSVHTDEEKVRRIVSNLVENALKYAPDGPVTVRTARTADGIAVSVLDEGPGVPPADRERVFEPFVQLDQSSTRRQGGTGLGLYLCRQLAELVGGRLELGDSPAGGACFTLRLPATSPEAGPSAPPTAAPASGPAPVEPEGVLV